MCVCEVDGKGVGKWWVDVTSELTFLHGSKCYKGGLAMRHMAASRQECESPSAAQNCPAL